MKKKASNQHNQMVGKWGENCAAEFLEKRGFLIIERNFRTPEGEIDLIAQLNDTLVFVEVKTRSHNLGGYPEEAVTDEKLEHMVNSAEFFLQDSQKDARDWRIDVISVTGKINSRNPQIEWFENAA